MSPRQQPTSRRYKNEGNADPAVEHQAPLTIVTEQISPANLEHKRNDFFTREQRWLTAFESSAIGITMADLDGHYLAANTVFQNMVGYAEAELKEFSFLDITYEEALAWYNSPAYKEVREHRFKGATYHVILIQGV